MLEQSVENHNINCPLSVMVVSGSRDNYDKMADCVSSLPSKNVDLYYCSNELEAHHKCKKDNVDICIVDHNNIKSATEDFISNFRRINHALPIILLEENLTQETYSTLDFTEADGCLSLEGLNPSMVEASLISAARLRDTTNNSQEILSALSYLGHEINTPLCSVLGFSELLLIDETATEEEKQKKYIEHIYDSGKVISQTIDDMRYLSKIEAGEYEIQYRDVDLNEFCEDLKIEFRTQLNKHKMSLNADIPTDLEPLRCDQILLNKLFKSIIHCSLSGAKPDSKINIKAVSDDNYTYISIDAVSCEMDLDQADGQTMSAKSFWQTTAEKNKGYGLGVPLSLSIMHAHEGEVILDSLENENKTLTLKFPK